MLPYPKEKCPAVKPRLVSGAGAKAMYFSLEPQHYYSW